MITKLTGLRLAAWVAIACAPVLSQATELVQYQTFTLSWEKPTRNEDGSPLTDLLGYYIYVGDSPQNMMPLCYTGAANSRIVLGSSTDTTRYYAVSAVNADGVESSRTGPIKLSSQ